MTTLIPLPDSLDELWSDERARQIEQGQQLVECNKLTVEQQFQAIAERKAGIEQRRQYIQFVQLHVEARKLHLKARAILKEVEQIEFDMATFGESEDDKRDKAALACQAKEYCVQAQQYRHHAHRLTLQADEMEFVILGGGGTSSRLK